MKEFLLVLFYQIIGAVNAAVIIGGIVWLAKRKDEKDGRKPNPDFTPTPEKKPEVELRSALIKTVNGEKIAQRWYSQDEEIPQYAILQGEPYKFLAEMDKDGGKLVEFVRIKPPTTGTNVIEPKKRKYDEYSALPYAVGTVQRFYKPILTSAIVLAEDGKIVIPTETTGKPVSGYGDGKIYGYVQTLAPDDGNDDGKAYPINPRTGEVEGYPAIDGVVYRVYFWTSGKAVKTVHTGPYSGPDKFTALKEAPVRTTHICKNCKHYLATEEGAATGLCGMMEEIVLGNSYRACFEKREEKDHE